jgi:hypothetical protein
MAYIKITAIDYFICTLFTTQHIVTGCVMEVAQLLFMGDSLSRHFVLAELVAARRT